MQSPLKNVVLMKFGSAQMCDNGSCTKCYLNISCTQSKSGVQRQMAAHLFPPFVSSTCCLKAASPLCESLSLQGVHTGPASGDVPRAVCPCCPPHSFCTRWRKDGQDLDHSCPGRDRELVYKSGGWGPRRGEQGRHRSDREEHIKVWLYS